MKLIQLQKEGALKPCSYPPYEDVTTAELNVKYLANALEREYPYKRFNLFCQGSSGIYIAGLLQVKLSLSPQIIYIRKQHESTHGSNEEGYPKDEYINVFADDFIGGGFTFGRVSKLADRSIQVVATVGSSNSMECAWEIIRNTCRHNKLLEPELFIQF